MSDLSSVVQGACADTTMNLQHTSDIQTDSTHGILYGGISSRYIKQDSSLLFDDGEGFTEVKSSDGGAIWTLLGVRNFW